MATKSAPLGIAPVLTFTLRGAWPEELRRAILADYESPEMVAYRAAQRGRVAPPQRGEATPYAVKQAAAQPMVLSEERKHAPRGVAIGVVELIERYGNPWTAERATGMSRESIRDAWEAASPGVPVPWRRGSVKVKKSAKPQAPLTRDEAIEIDTWYSGRRTQAENNLGLVKGAIRAALMGEEK